MASVEIRGLRKFYGTTQILHGVDIDINDGEFVVLVGPSGCGKSTLLRMIAGLEEVSEGEIRIDGAVVNGLPPKQRDLAMVFQSYALYPHMTVAQNMGFSLRLANADKAVIETQVRRAAEVLDLVSFLDRYPRHLSGGQRQRVAMGRAIVRNPKVFLFDEPLSNLDAKLRGQMRAEIKSLHQRLKTTTIYVTHDQTEAMTMADKIVVLRNGRVEQVGPPMEVYREPANSFVAGFIGSPSMNFFHGMVSASTLKLNERLIEFPSRIDALDGREVLVGIRPKHMLRCTSESKEGHPFRVELVEPTGDEMDLTGTICGKSATMVIPAADVRPSDIINVMLPTEALYLFDAETGSRIA
ncbi:ABC transporter ATP-binding protein [Aminobacter aganoensis]|uniref:Multiple sugar transport system ATP-binding protein n=1 Tax=Aminobacter aganoensis TaxID=83264 RepID=A0A7X0FEC8_9HYPH|nr:sn-glycerol-3-phosphate ABC transporter ATP-binding protein UgpC [Aminobacter aganoensis]MBB6357878.1 multiple sugar transport system ATP-binding protein [Aminobacter aganoensis]